MKQYIAYCGLDCESCEARRATLNDDNSLRRKVAKEWYELNGVEITPEMINCVGCLRIALPDPSMCHGARHGDLRELWRDGELREAARNYHKQRRGTAKSARRER